MFSVLNNLDEWISLGLEEQDMVIYSLNKKISQDFAYLFTRSYCENISFRIPTYKHILSGIEMNLIPGGRFKFGLSEEEAQQALNIMDPLPFDFQTMRPVQEVEVPAFFISRFPILELFAVDNIEIDEKMFRPDFGEFGDKIPIYLTRKEVNELCCKFNLDIPTEIQWEFAVRGGTGSLFYFGESLPDDEILENEVCLINFSDESLNIQAANNFGLVGLMIGDWVKDQFRENYAIPASYKESPPFAIRGGAAASFPWQDNTEWTLCISAMRYSSEFLEDQTCGGRFVKSLNLEQI